jgi:hypothetical protein
MKVPFGVNCFTGFAIIKLNAKILDQDRKSLREEYKNHIWLSPIGKGLTRLEGVLKIDDYQNFKTSLNKAILRRKMSELQQELDALEGTTVELAWFPF